MEKLRVLVSVTDKTGLENLRPIASMSREIFSTADTTDALKAADIPCVAFEPASEVAAALQTEKEILSPAALASVSPRWSYPLYLGDVIKNGLRRCIQQFDIVVINMFNFNRRAVVDQDSFLSNTYRAAMLRVAAESSRSMMAVVDFQEYAGVIEELGRSNGNGILIPRMSRLAMKALQHLINYDLAIADWFDENSHQIDPIISSLTSRVA